MRSDAGVTVVDIDVYEETSVPVRFNARFRTQENITMGIRTVALPLRVKEDHTSRGHEYMSRASERGLCLEDRDTREHRGRRH